MLLNTTNMVLLNDNVSAFQNYMFTNQIDIYYYNLIINNYLYPLFSYKVLNSSITYFPFISFFKVFFKLNILFFCIYSLFLITYIQNYIKQLILMNTFVKLFILNESEKEVGPVDDFFFFAVLFLVVISSFLIGSIVVILFQTSLFIWMFGALFLLAILILTIPVNLFIDFGISFFVYIRGSSSSSSLIKELLFDIISTFTVFIRFVIQNIRFLFIFLAIFELLEWVFGNNSGLFLANYYTNNNIFINLTLNDYLYSNKSVNLLIINSILFIILYFYYFLHLLFLLVVQVTIYVGISIWLFFFLYSTKFLGKYEKFFNLKK